MAILRSTLWLSLSDGIVLIASAVVSILIARYLGADALGEYSIAITLGTIVQMIADAGYSIGLARKVAAMPEAIISIVSAAIGTKITLWLIALPGAITTALLQSVPTSLLTAIVLCDVGASCVTFSILGALRGIGNFVMPQLLSSAYQILATVAMGALLVYTSTLPLVLGAMVAIGFLRAVHLHQLFRKQTGRSIPLATVARHISLRAIAHELGTHWRLWVINIASMAIHRLPLVILGLRSSSTEVGYFSAAFRIYSAARIVPGALFTVSVPEMATLSARPKIARKILVVGAGLSFVLASMMWISAPWVITATFQFDASIVPLRVMALAFGGLSLKTTLEAILIGRMHDSVVAWIVSIVAFLTIFATWIVPASAVWYSFVLAGSEWLLCILFWWFGVHRHLFSS